jgi:hypothetical protein
MRLSDLPAPTQGSRMRLRTTTTVLGLTTLTLPGCSNSPSTAPGSSSPAATAQPKTDAGDAKPGTPLLISRHPT